VSAIIIMVGFLVMVFIIGMMLNGTMTLEHFYGYPKRYLTEPSNLTMYPDAEEEIKIRAFKNVLSSLYEHVRKCKICDTYLNAILEHAVKSKNK
jgi:hypothetical protein